MEKLSQQTITVVPPGEGRGIWVLGDPYTFKIVGEQTGGRYAVFVNHVSPGTAVPPHIHHAEHEGFYVLEGEVTFYHESGSVRATTGTYVDIPIGALHYFKNETDHPAKLLVILAPAGFENFFEATGTPIVDPDQPPPVTQETIDRMLAVASEYHLEFK